MKCSLVVQSYGRELEFNRGIFAVWSFFAHSSYANVDTQAIVFTDNPDYFKPYLKDLPVIYRQLSSENIKAMRGAVDFVHRVKIEIIAAAFQLIDGPMFYVDSDTCFIQDPDLVVRELKSDTACMHQYEYRFEAMKRIPPPTGTPFHVFYDFVTSREFKLTSGASIKISPQQISWNAGVIVLLPEHKKYLADVLKLTDDFYPDTHHHGCEQYAFNIILGQNLSMITCTDTVFHYWPMVQKAIADIYLSDKLTTSWAQRKLGEKATDIKRWTLDMPGFVANHFLMLHDIAMQHFNANNFRSAWPATFRVLKQHPGDLKLWRDILYHLKRNLAHLFARTAV